MELVDRVIQALLLVGGQTPAALQLLAIIKDTWSESDVAVLEERLRQMNLAADDQHRLAQEDPNAAED